MAGSYQELCSEQNLIEAWRYIRKKPRVAPGIDEETLEEFERDLPEQLKGLQGALNAHEFIPAPNREVLIPKHDDRDSYRALALPTIRDKLIQQALRQVIEPFFEPEFLDCSYAYRSGKSTFKAIRRVRHILNQKRSNFYAARDIDNFFDSIDHEELVRRVGEKVDDPDVLQLIRLFLKGGVIQQDGRWRDKIMGIPTGAIMSPLLSNIYLHPFDLALRKRGYDHVRYADDWIILSRGRKYAQDALGFASSFLENILKLKLNPSSPGPQPTKAGIMFLGLIVQRDSYRIDPKKLRRVSLHLETIKQRTLRSGLGWFLELIRRKVTGWSHYYKRTGDRAQLQKIEDEILGFLAQEISRRKLDWQPEGWVPRVIWPLSEAGAALKKLRQKLQAEQERIREQKEQQEKEVKQARLAKRSKRRYRRIHMRRAEWVIWEKGSEIHAISERLVIRRNGKKIKERPAGRLRSILVKHKSVSVTGGALQLCARHEIQIAFLHPKGAPYAHLWFPESGHLDLHLAQLKVAGTPKGNRIAREIVTAKLKNQRNLIKYALKIDDEEFKDELLSLIEKIDLVIASLKELPLEVENYRERLMGKEGNAAIHYWRAFNLLNHNFDFPGRRHQGAKDISNSLLNYGYGILYSKIQSCIIREGFHPQLSFLHKPMRKRPTLSFDIIEAFRAPYVDRLVLAYMNRGRTTDMDGDLLAFKTRKSFSTTVLERMRTETVYRSHTGTFEEILSKQLEELKRCLLKGGRFRGFVQRW